MEDLLRIEEKHILLFTKGNHFRYRGLVLEETPAFLKVKDDRDGKIRVFAKSEIASLEVMP